MTKGKTTRLYTLQVFIIWGPINEEFAGQEISRTIQIEGSQTLETLHHAIFEAFDREDEHMYEFNLGEGPDDTSALYVLPAISSSLGYDESALGLVTTTTIDALGLKVDRAFGYRFDFGDDWLHQINVVAIDEVPASGRYPKITGRVGDSPPQYPDFDDDDFVGDS
jgi:hypothetical protein